MIAIALALLAATPPSPVATPAPAPLEVALAEGLAPRTVVVLDSPVVPERVELAPDGVAIASAWYRLERGVLIVVPLPAPTARDAALRVWSRSGAAPGAGPLSVRAAITPERVPLAAPVRGRFVALELPPRSSLRALLLRGELDGARLLFQGRRLAPREGPFAGRLVTLVPEGVRSLLVIVPELEEQEVALASASLHTGYPLPAPETFRLAPGQAGEYAFEVPQRDHDAVVIFEAFDASRPEELSIAFEGQRVSPAPAAAPVLPGSWSPTRELVLPAERFARGRVSLLTFRFAPATPGTGPADAGGGLRRLNLDVPLPASGPFGLGPDGDGDHGGELLGSFWPESPEPHLVRFRARDLDRSGELEVRALGVELGIVGVTAAATEVEGEVEIPAELIRPGELNTVTVRPARSAWTPVPWSVSELRVVPRPPPPPTLAVAPPEPPRESGPEVSLSETGEGGRPSLSELSGFAPFEIVLPGQPAEPVGKVEFIAAVPVAEPVIGAPPPGRSTGRSYDEGPIGPPAPMGPEPEPPGTRPSGPTVARDLPSGASGEGLPGAPSLTRGPDLPPERKPELPVAAPLPVRGAALDLRSDPPGARVFLARAPGMRGVFLGLTPVTVFEETRGPVFLRFDLPGHHEGVLGAWLPGAGSLTVSRSLLPWKGIDFSRPSDPRGRGARSAPEGYAAPAPADLDGDGRVDLVVGGDKGGVYWLRNEEMLGPPRFGPAEALRLADGRPLAVEGYAAPAAADWDGDGLVDLLVGEKSGQVRFFRRAPPSRGLAFEDRGALVADGTVLSAGNDAVPMVVDWNGDLHADLMVGSGYGVVVLFEGRGAGALSQRGPVQQEGKPLQFLLDAVPIDYGDWTGDGRRDLVLAGMYGNVLLFEGRGAGGGLPDFAAPRPVTIRGGLDLYVGTYPHGFAFDLDGDGYRDLVFGNSAGEILWLRGGEPHEFDEIEPAIRPARAR